MIESRTFVWVVGWLAYFFSLFFTENDIHKCFIFTQTIECFFMHKIHMWFFFYFCSPVFPTRTTYTPSSSNLHYFQNPSPPESQQMWSTSAHTDEFDRSKPGALPGFQRLTNSSYYPNERTINYSSQVVRIHILIFFNRFFVFFLKLNCRLFEFKSFE